MKKLKAVVTGGAGYIGAHLANELAKKGYEVAALDLNEDTHGWLESTTPFVRADIRNKSDLEPIFKDADVVFHCAALPRVQFSIAHPEKTHDANVNGTFAVLCAAKDTGVRRVVHSSSSSVYGDQDTFPLEETFAPNPKSPYALHKYIGELYCKTFSDIYGLETVSLRYFNVYGPYGDPDGPYALVIPKFIRMREKELPLTITGDGTQTRDFTHVRDVVRANILAAESAAVGHGEVINVGAGNGVSVNRIAELVGGPVEYIPARLEPHDTLASTTRAKELLSWEPTVSIEEGVAEIKKLAGLT